MPAAAASVVFSVMRTRVRVVVVALSMTGCAAKSGSGGAAGAGAAGSAGVAGASGASGDVAPRDAATSDDGRATGDVSGAAGASPTDAGSGDVVTPPVAWPNQALLYKATMTAPPKLTDTDQTTDAPLLGNGDLGVAIFGGADALTFNLHKNEFWSLSEAKVKAMAQLALAIPSLAGATYQMVEDFGHGEVTGTFTAGGKTLTTKTWVQADDSTRNKVITQLTLAGGGAVDVSASLSVGADNSYATATGASGDVLYRDVRADASDTVGGQATRRVRVATRAVGVAGTVANGVLTFTLTSGSTVALVTGVMSNLDAAAYQTTVLASVAALAPADVATFESAQRAWWDAFFRKSFVEIPDKTLEREYYASLYFLACVSRTGEQPPGLWGNWVMKDPAWNGDYTLNYNYEVPFYASFPTNHVELADSYDQPVIAWVPNAQALATKEGYAGAYYRVHIGPIPSGSADTNEWNQKFNNAYAATDMIMHYDVTRDPAYAARIYPTLKQMSTFWAAYLTKDGTRYVIDDDAQHEGNPYPQTNGVMSLGLVRLLLQASINLGAALGTDADLRATWQDRLTNLSAFPTFVKDGKTVFRYTEVGLDWNGGNAIGIQHIYPGGQIGLGSDPTLLATAQNMVSAMARWDDDNGTNTFYPAAARVGHDPNDILTHLASWVGGHSYANLHIHTGGGGIENFNTVPSTIAEMLLQSFQGKLRVFADWPNAGSTDARFGDLRASGAFLVSSALKGGVVQYVRIVSEQGGDVVL
ncbi:MAG TPA: hypothetical protein VH560_04485, partial [Polyangia bacterium]|nr:hypothetical protein [Polyangia bacterium]